MRCNKYSNHPTHKTFILGTTEEILSRTRTYLSSRLLPLLEGFLTEIFPDRSAQMCAKSRHAQRPRSLIAVSISKGDSLSAFPKLPYQSADLAIRERHAPDSSGRHYEGL